MRRDQEAACDARVLGDRDPATRAAYARVIASFAVPSRLGPRADLAAPMACPVLGDKSIVHRLRSLTMTDISARRRRAGRWALVLSGALALPLTATVVYADQDRDRTRDAPVAPAAPDAPPAPEARGVAKRVTIVTEHADDAAGKDRPKPKHEKRLERDGKTIVIHSDKPIDEAELEAKLAELEKTDLLLLRDGPLPPGEPGKLRKIVMVRERPDGTRLAHAFGKCEAGKTLADVNAGAESSTDGGQSVHRTRILLCGPEGEGRAEAAARVRKARERLAQTPGMQDPVRADVLRQLDETVARLERGPE
jgi:hypothetical protein